MFCRFARPDRTTTSSPPTFTIQRCNTVRNRYEFFPGEYHYTVKASTITRHTRKFSLFKPGLLCGVSEFSPVSPLSAARLLALTSREDGAVRSSTEQYGAVRPNKVSRRTEKVLAEMALRSPLQCNPGFWRFRTIFPIMRVQVRSFISSTEYARMIGDRQRRINAGTVKPVS
jgi:hypothetical protein